MPPTAPLSLIHRKSGDSAHRQWLGPYAIEPLIARDEEGAATVYRVSIAAHTRTGISFHARAEEYYFVLSGQGKAILDGKELAITAGDFLRLPPGMTHGFVTEDQPLEMLDVHTPGCWPDRDTYFT